MPIYNPSGGGTGTIPDLIVTKLGTSANTTVTAGYGAYIPGNYEIAVTHYLEIPATSKFEIG